MIQIMLDKGKYGIFVNPRARSEASKLIAEAKNIGPYTEKLITFALRHYTGMNIVRNNYSNASLCEPEEMSMMLCAGLGIR